ncbi:MAG: UPF0175 family protein [Acidobacteria bacterium]|nr:UPF0175 family protein [Acidobacteriota bacterium]
MNVAIELPEDIARKLKTEWHDLPRRTLEALAVEGYRAQLLTRGEVQRLLNLSWHETEAFLKERQAYLHYTEKDLQQDRETHDRVMSR